MKKEEILQQAITKAEENGFKNNLGNPDWTYSDKNLGYFANLLEEHIYEAIIFSHDFAKAFWGEEVLFQGGITVDEYIEDWVKKNSGRGKYKPQEALKIAKNDIAYWTKHKQLREAWAWHLQQMVLEENPLEYLAKFLKGK